MKDNFHRKRVRSQIKHRVGTEVFRPDPGRIGCPGNGTLKGFGIGTGSIRYPLKIPTEQKLFYGVLSGEMNTL